MPGEVFMRQFLLTILLSSTVIAQVPLIPRGVLFGNPERAAPQISPDGKQLAWLAPEEGVLNVWVKTVGKEDGRAVTKDRKRGIRVYYWQPDSRHILYVQDTAGDENFRIHQTDIASKETKTLTPFEKTRAGILAVDPAHPDQMLVELNKRNPQLFDVYRYNFKTGALDMDTENPGDVNEWAADNDLQVRAAKAVMPGGIQEIRVRADAESPWKALQKWGPDENDGAIAGFSGDNKSLWLVSSVDANTSRLLQMDVATGKTSVAASDPRYDVSGILENPKTHKLEAVAFVRDKTQWELLDKSLQPDFDALNNAHGSDFRVTSRDFDDKNWIVAFTSDVSSPAYYMYDRATKKAQFLFTAIPALEKYKLAKVQPVSYKARDGLNIQGYLTMPSGMEKNAPMVMLVHGGPWARDVWGYSPLVQMLANRGYAVLQPNFRGSTGYGKSFVNAGDREWGAKMHDDLLDAKAWAIKQGYADPKKVCIMGGSYGGYATLVAVTFTPTEFACGVDIVGPSNLFTLLKSIPPYWATMRATMDKRMGSIDKDEDFLRSRSPLFKADRIQVPLLIGQGANDPRVNQRESDQIVKAMRDNGKPVEYIVFPDEGHGFARPENNLRFFAATEQFLAKYLGGRAEPPSDKEKWDAFVR
jgi:dipeptidyl aminopeptidase/acylaminoacyl peptidase